MYVRYGSYQHAVNDAAVVIKRTPNFNEGGEHFSTTETWMLNGFLQASTQAELTTAIQDLQAAYALHDRDLGLFLDDGSATAHGIYTSQTVDGVHVTSGPSFPDSSGAEYTTYRSYTVELQFTVATLGNGLLAYHERLSFEGGGPRWGYLQTINGVPQKQLLAELTPQRVTQRGTAVGYLEYPVPASPIWPEAEHIDKRVITYQDPKRTGVPALPRWTEFPVEWSYEFESAIPLTGFPNRWIV